MGYIKAAFRPAFVCPSTTNPRSASQPPFPSFQKEKKTKRNTKKMSLSKASIRTLTIADLDECMRIEHAAFEKHEWFSREIFFRCLSGSPELCFGIFFGGRLIGQAISTRTQHPTFVDSCMDTALKRPDGPTIVLMSLAVLPEFQEKKFGTTLMTEYIRVIQANEKKRNFFSQAPAGRIALIARDELLPFYRRFNFVSLGESQAEFAGGGWLDLVLKF